jgi:phage-related protein
MKGSPRKISWIKGARKEFLKSPAAVQEITIDALTIAAKGEKAAIAKPMKGLGSGIFGIALSYRGDAYRALYAVQIDEDIWVVHAFQKKSRKGIKTPQKDIELIRERLKQLKEQLK